MKMNINDIILRNKVFAWIGLATGVLLLAIFIAMQFISGMNWDETDFLVMSCLLFGSGSLFVLAARKTPRNYWGAIGVALVLVFFYLWAELAVGILTHLGS